MSRNPEGLSHKETEGWESPWGTVVQCGWSTKWKKGEWSFEAISHMWDHLPCLILWTSSFLYWSRLGILAERIRGEDIYSLCNVQEAYVVPCRTQTLFQ